MRTTTFTFFDYLPDPLRELPKRRAAELIGLGVLAALVAACARAADLVGRRPQPQSRDGDADPQSARPPRRDRRRYRDAVFRPRLRRRADRARVLGLAAGHARSASIGSASKLALVARRLDAGGRLRLAAAGAGELAAAHRASAASSATPCCGSPRHLLAGSAGRHGARRPGAGRPDAILALTAAAGYRLSPPPSRRRRRRRPTPPRRAARPSATTSDDEDSDGEPGFGLVSLGAVIHTALTPQEARCAACSPARRRAPRPPARRRARPGSAANPPTSPPTSPPSRRDPARASSRR